MECWPVLGLGHWEKFRPKASFSAIINLNQFFWPKLTKTSFFGQNRPKPGFFGWKSTRTSFVSQNLPKPVFLAKNQFSRPISTKSSFFRPKTSFPGQNRPKPDLKSQISNLESQNLKSQNLKSQNLNCQKNPPRSNVYESDRFHLGGSVGFVHIRVRICMRLSILWTKKGPIPVGTPLLSNPPPCPTNPPSPPPLGR